MVKPIHHIRMENVECAIWQNIKGDKTFYSVEIYRNFMDESGTWKKYTLMRKQDLLTASLIMQKAYEWLTTYKAEKNELE